MVLEAVYEQDFRDGSYGFRPGRSAHQALEALWGQTMKMAGGWVLEVDIRKFFDTLDHGQLRDLLRRRVQDGVLLRLIGKWLNAGVLEDGGITHPETGTPQGGVISPLLANVYLHEVLDVWFEEQVRPRLKGHAHLVRYADDFVILFAEEEDARRVMDVLPKRFGRYGLTLHPDKTRLVPFRRPDRLRRPFVGGDEPRPGSFDLLGFTHFWGLSRNGRWVVKRKTAKSRFSRALRRVAEWCWKNRHLPLAVQHRTLVQKLRGHCGYYGITGNGDALARFRYELTHRWKRALDRRSQRAYLRWERFRELLRRFPLPNASPVHSVCRPVANP
jgi:group II intron reverse transcriptase/maturase